MRRAPPCHPEALHVTANWQEFLSRRIPLQNDSPRGRSLWRGGHIEGQVALPKSYLHQVEEVPAEKISVNIAEAESDFQGERAQKWVDKDSTVDSRFYGSAGR